MVVNVDIRKILNEEIKEKDLENYRIWNVDTTIQGVSMNDYDTFVDKVLLASHIWPQLNEDGIINYLFGLGIGIELALQGDVIGRRKNNNCFEYREHYNMYLYGLRENNNEFNKIFRPITFNRYNTLELHNLDENLLATSYDVVRIHNHKVYIPSLEILFLDSYLSREMNKRQSGCDYELLMREYDLDVNRIISYLERYYINYLISIGDSKYDSLADEQIKAIENIINNGKRVDRSLFNLEEQISAYPKGSNFKYAGIYVDLWIPISADSVVYNSGSYKIMDDNYMNKLKNRVYLYKENDLQRYEEITMNIKNLFKEGND